MASASPTGPPVLADPEWREKLSLSVDEMAFPWHTVISGGTNSGKTVLMWSIVTQIQARGDLFAVILVTPNKKMQREATKFLPHTMIVPEFSNEALDNILKFAEAVQEDREHEKCNKVIVVFDDCQDEEGFLNSRSLKKLFTRGRHANLSVMCLCQTLTGCHPTIRKQANLVLQAAVGSGDEQRAFYTMYAKTVFDSEDKFSRFFAQLTSDGKRWFLAFRANDCSITNKEKVRCMRGRLGTAVRGVRLGHPHLHLLSAVQRRRDDGAGARKGGSALAAIRAANSAARSGGEGPGDATDLPPVTIDPLALLAGL